MGWLEKRFLGDATPMEPAVRKRLGTLGSAVGIVVNAALSVIKFAVGSLTGSVAVAADAVNNLSDAAASVVSLVSIRMGQKPMDREHPFGHGRAEYLGALAVGVLILVMGVETLLSGVRSILTPVLPEIRIVTGVLLMISILLKGGLFLFDRWLGNLIDAASLRAAAADSLSDMLATLAVLVSLVAAAIWQTPLDGPMGVLVSLLVLKAGFSVVKEMVDTLMGGRQDPALGREIISRMKDYEDILGVHDLLIHDYGPGRRIASLHAEVPADGSLMHLHNVIDRAEREIGESLGLSLCIHLDPVHSGDAETNAVQTALRAVLAEQSGCFTLHDLYAAPSAEGTKFIFDVVIPADFRDADRLTEQLNAAACSVCAGCRCVIRYEHDQYAE